MVPSPEVASSRSLLLFLRQDENGIFFTSSFRCVYVRAVYGGHKPPPL